MSDLKPCPFCGGEPELMGGGETSEEGACWWVRCHACGCSQGVYLLDDGGVEAIEAWNRRAQPAITSESGNQAAQGASAITSVPLHQALTDPENQPNQYGAEFLMHGPKFAFKVGNQQFTLDYEPTEPGEFEYMRDMLIHAFSTFTPDVKTAPAVPLLTEELCPSCRNGDLYACTCTFPKTKPQPEAVPGLTEFLADLSRSRTKYPNNARMWDGLMGELDELRRAYHGDGDQRAEAFDVAVCAFRIATEGDAGDNRLLAQAEAMLTDQEVVDLCDGTLTTWSQVRLARAVEQAVRAKMGAGVPMPPEDWSVFNTGAEVASGLTWAEAWDYMTPSRIDRGWTAVCVADKSNIGIVGKEGGNV